MERIQSEPVGFLNAIERNQSNVTQGSFGTNVESVVTGDVTISKSSSYTPQMSSSDGPDDADTKDTFALDTHLKFEASILPEQMLHADNVGLGGQSQLQRRITKGLRGMRNQVEADVALALAQASSRSVGVSGTTPFASNYNLLEDSMKILVDNGGNRHDGQNSVVMNTSASANLRKLAQLQQVNTSGGGDLLRNGVLLDLNGYMIRESAGIALHTKGAGTGALVNDGSGLSVGVTAIPFDTMTVNSTGIKAGDVITFAADTDNEYVVVTGSTSVSGTITIGGPGLQVAIPNNNAITITATYTPNIAFNSEAAELASRAPVLGDDKAILHDTITDDLAGLTYAFSIYPGEGMQLLRVQSFFGQKVWNQYLVNTIKG